VHIDPTPEQAKAFGAAADGDEPVFMLNLLRFKERADGVDAGDGISGLEAYQRYAASAASHLARVGGEMLWAGACDPALIGPSDAEWDVVAVVRYPSRAAFLQMVGDPDYQATVPHRSAALADSRLIPCAAAPFPR
jgi:uncharacterized protein (DUF1330 family)